jgi:hypothetical protein
MTKHPRSWWRRIRNLSSWHADHLWDTVLAACDVGVGKFLSWVVGRFPERRRAQPKSRRLYLSLERLEPRLAPASAVTSISLTSLANPAAPGQSVTLTALVSSTGGTPTGTVTFKDGTNVLGTATLSPGVAGADASFAATGLAAGFHSLMALYGGDSTFFGSSSSSLDEIVQQVNTSTSLSSSASVAAPGQSVAFTATVSGANSGTATGTVTFLDGATVLGTGTLSAGGAGAQATFSTSSLGLGSHSITAVYGGDTAFASSTSANSNQMGRL